jgi:hypothetical protein
MQKKDLLPKLTLSFILLLSALESLVSIKNLYSLPGDNDNLFLFGLSLPRVIVISLLFLTFFFCLLIALLVLLNKVRWQQIHLFIKSNFKPIAITTGVSSILFCFFMFYPSYRYGHYAAYFDRLKPILSWVFLFSTQFLFYLALIRIRTNLQLSSFSISKKSWGSFLIFCTFFFLIIVVVTITGWGVSPIVRFWEKTGVPILSGQSYWAWVASIGLVFFLPVFFPKAKSFPANLSKHKWLIFLAIWIISAVLWMREPIQFNHFNPGPFPPNYQHYPNSDAQYYDLSAQRALLGQDQFLLDKPLYSTLLLGYHLLAGQNSDLMIQIQTALFSVFPALLFLLGTYLHHPYSGLIAAIFANFRVINSIVGQTWIWKTSSPKLMMTEFPSAILILILTLTLIGWFSSKHNRTKFILASGGILALATLMRHNNWIFLPMIVVFSLLVFWNQKKVWLKSVLIFILMVFLTSTPMMIYTQKNTGVPFTFLIALKGSVINTRILPQQSTESNSVTVNNDNQVIEESQPNVSVQTTNNNEPNLNLDSSFNPGRIYTTSRSPQPINAVGQTDFIFINPLLDTMIRHLFHNLVSTGLSMPVSQRFDSLEYFLRESSLMNIWDIEWNGKLPFNSWIILSSDFILISIALAFSWRKWHWVGITPLAMMLTYYAGNAFATTSGGRYLIPVDWAIYFYYALGIVITLMYFADRLVIQSTLNFSEYQAQEIELSQIKLNLKNNSWIFLLFFGIVMLVAIGMNGFKQKYPDYSSDEILNYLTLSQANIEQDSIQPYVEAVRNQKLMAIHGSLLYPIYLNYQNDEDYEVETQTFEKKLPALYFTVLSNERDFIMGRLLLNSPPQKLQDGVEAVVFTCPNHEAYALLILDGEQGSLLQRSDWDTIECSK